MHLLVNKRKQIYDLDSIITFKEEGSTEGTKTARFTYHIKVQQEATLSAGIPSYTETLPL